MRGKFTFREPLFVDEDGLYITAAQMQFFLNRRNGAKKLSRGDAEFFSFYTNCRTYNLIYDMMDKDPDCAKMYWDPHTDAVALSFPMKGEVAKTLSSITRLEEDDDDEDVFGLFS
tara:strand:+ start:253 stop:597 length:345 start_codon:yes stop_codon:yes gene_type:complete